MNNTQLEQLKADYAELIVEGMDMNDLITFAVESIERNLSDWTEDEVKGEISEHYGEETLECLLTE